MRRLSPSLAVMRTPSSRLTMYCRRGAGCQSRSCSAWVSRKMMPVAGRRLESLLPRRSSAHSISMSRKCDWPFASVYKLWIRTRFLPVGSVAVMVYARSFAAKAGEPDYFRKGLDVGTQDLVELLRRGRCQEVVVILEPFLDIGQLENAPDLVADLVQDGTWRTGGREHDVRSIPLVAGHQLRESRHVRQER